MEHSLHVALVGIFVTSSVLIIGTNLLLLALVLYTPGLRTVPRNAFVVGISVADLLLGCFVLPMFTRALVERSTLDCHTHLAVKLIADHGVYFVVGWTLATLNVLHVVQMRRQRRYLASLRLPATSPPLSHQSSQTPVRTVPDASPTDPGDPQSQLNYHIPCPRFCHTVMPGWAKATALALLPWVAAAATIIPLVLPHSSSVRIYSLELEDVTVLCMLSLPLPVLVVANFLSIYLPYYVCVAALVTMLFCHGRSCRSHSPYSGNQSNRDRRHREQNSIERELGEDEEDGVPADFVNRGLDEDPEARPNHESIHVSPQPCTPNGDSGTSRSDGSSSTSPVYSRPFIKDDSQGSSPSETCPPAHGQPSEGDHGRDLVRRESGSSRQRLEHRRNFRHFYFISPDLENPLAPCLPNAVYLLCSTPLVLHTWLQLSDVRTPNRMVGFLVFLDLGRSFLMPFAWLAYPDIRREAAENWRALMSFVFSLCGRPVVGGGPRGRAQTSSASSVTFSRLQETQAV